MAAEHILRRATPYTLRAIDRELLLLQGKVDRASDARLGLRSNSRPAQVKRAHAKWQRLSDERDRLVRLRVELLEVRRG